MSFRELFLASVLIGATISVAVGSVAGVGHGDTAGTSGAVASDAGSGVVEYRQPATATARNVTESRSGSESAVSNDTVFRRIETDTSSFVIEMNLSMLTSFFKKGSTFRLVTGGTARGNRVVWFDIGLGYTGGSVLENPLDNFVVRSEMWIDFPVL